MPAGKWKSIIVLVIVICSLLSGCGRQGPNIESGIKYDVNNPIPPITLTPSTPTVEITTPASGSSFLSTDSIALNALVFNCNYSINDCNWIIERCESKNGSITTIESTTLAPPGTSVYFNQNVPPDTSGREYKIYYNIFFKLNNGGINVVDSVYIIQSEVDQCRQEYIDVQRNGNSISRVPGSNEFTWDEGREHFSFWELNKGDYTCAILTDGLLNGLENTRNDYGCAMEVSSGYRNPIHNETLTGSALNSSHIFGRAADIIVVDINQNDLIERAEWDELANAARMAGATYIEPYEDTGRWVHMSW